MSEQSIARMAANLRQFIKFGMVGGSGALVNFAVFVLCKKIAEDFFHVHETDVWFPILGTEFNVRWYNVFMVIAFLVANTWNYQLNRMWTFKSVSSVSWLRGFFPFLLTGLGALIVSQIFMVLLMNPTTPIGLPREIFDDSNGLRTMSYWANMISVILAMPVNFIINKLWTFRSRPEGPRVVHEQEPA